MKFSGKVGNGPVNKRLNFDPDHESGSGFGSRPWYDMLWRRYALSQCF